MKFENNPQVDKYLMGGTAMQLPSVKVLQLQPRAPSQNFKS